MNCFLCPLGELAITNCIPTLGSGSILIVTSSPTSEDDVNGNLATGVLGRLLLRVLQDAGLEPQDYTLTSAVRCTIPRNYPRTTQSIEACRSYLRALIRRMGPEKIISFGEIALRALTGKSGLKTKRGSEISLHHSFDYPMGVFPTYAMDLIQRVPTLKRTVTADIRSAVGNNEDPGEITWRYWNDGDVNLPPGTWAWDIETAIDGKIVDYPTMVSASNGTVSLVAIGEDHIRAMATALQHSEVNLVTFNGYQFDLPIMRRFGYDIPMGDDTMYLAFMDDETQPLGLEALAAKYLKVKGWKHGDWKTFDPNSVKAAQYAARDARYTFQLYESLRSILGSRTKMLRKILIPARVAFDAQTERGIYIDPKAVERERVSSVHPRDAALRELISMAGSDFNPNSTSQVGRYLQQCGVPLPLLGTGKPSTGMKVLNAINNDFTRSLLQYRKASKTLGTYVKQYREITETEDGRVHPEYTLIRTLTGRSSARNLNVQNLTRSFKDFFAAPPGRAFVECDFSAIEFRIAAWLAREASILESYAKNPDWDPHRYVASLFYRKPVEDVTKSERQIAKSANFGLLYLGNGYTLYEYAEKMGVPIPLDQADALYRFFHETFPGFKEMYARTKDELRTTGRIVCPTGHIRHFGDFELLLPGMRLEALRQAVNCKVQNTAAHLAYIALAEIHKRGLPHIGFVHDSFFFEFPSESDAKSCMAEIEYCMTEYPREFLAREFDVDLDIVLRIESKIRVNNG